MELNPGNLIIALPSIIGDVHFHRSVIYIVEYKQESAFGFIINKELNYFLNDVVEGFQAKIPLYYGGPVEPDNLFFIHQLGTQIPNSIAIDSHFYWSGDFDTLVQLLNKDHSLVNKIRFFLGYSGWDKNQLQNELHSKAWLKKENTYGKDLLTKTSQSLWRNEIISLGGKYIIWANAPDNPSSN